MDKSPSDIRIFLAGARGVTGSAQVNHLVQQGHPVRVMSRNPERLREMFGNTVEVVTGDVTDPSSLSEAMDGCQGLHISLNSPSSPRQFNKIEYEGTCHLLSAAKTAGIVQITYISSATVHADSRLRVYETKKRTEDLLLNQSIPATIFRMSIMMEMLLQLVHGHRAIYIGHQRQPYHFIAAKDLAVMVSLAHTKPSGSGIYYAYGPESMRMPDALQMILDSQGGGKATMIPVGAFAILANIAGGRAKFAYKVTKYLEQNEEPTLPTETEEMFGRNTTTLAQWIMAK